MSACMTAIFMFSNEKYNSRYITKEKLYYKCSGTGRCRNYLDVIIVITLLCLIIEWPINMVREGSSKAQIKNAFFLH